MSLAEYHRKRHFQTTPEPRGTVGKRLGRSFTVQKHAASHLHYDFRLELSGVLKSWAVPKGPSLDPTVKRLAVHVEDHPIDYGSFEGTIPAGEYGGGTVMLWDHGDWEPIGDPLAGYRAGKLKFELHGEKLRGRWMLVRGGFSKSKDKRNWLLCKERDEEARVNDEYDVLVEEDASVKTGRSLDEIAAKAKSHRKPKPAKATPKRKRSPSPVVSRVSRQATKPRVARLPAKVDVQLATAATDAPAGNQWLHEIKFDGYRMLCRIEQDEVKFITRNQHDWTTSLPELTAAVQHLPVVNAILDGEVVVQRADGTTDFQQLQSAFRKSRDNELRYFVFDLLYLNGLDLRPLPLVDRKTALASLFSTIQLPQVTISDHSVGDGPQVLEHARELGLEGIISKRADQPYRSGRSTNWLKVKCLQHEDFVIGGYTDRTGSQTGFGALLLGYYDARGTFHYAGKVGTGFDHAWLQSIHASLKELTQSRSPFSKSGTVPPDGRSCHWVKPEVVVQVKFGNWTRDRVLRHASFQGIREDKSADEVVHDLATVHAKASPPKRNQGEDQTAAERSDKTTDPRLTNPDRMLYPKVNITKRDLAAYYEAVTPWILPHLVDRPLVVVRCPQGQTHACFYQKHPTSGTPDEFARISIREKTNREDYLVVKRASNLPLLAQMSALELHCWGSHIDKLENPDRLIFDLDPAPDVPWKVVVKSARDVRDFLQELKLVSFLKTTGGKGLHIVVPIERRHDWSVAKAFCKRVAELIVTASPQRFTATLAKQARVGKIFIDYLRNGRGATAVAPYSTRANEQATVSVPIAWEELSPQLRSDHFTVQNTLQRLTDLKADPWQAISKQSQSLSKPLAILQSLSNL